MPTASAVGRGLALIAIAILCGAFAARAGAATDWSELGPGQNQFTPWGNFDLTAANHIPVIAWTADDPADASKEAAVRAAGANVTAFTMPKSPRGVLVSLEGAGRAPRVKLRSPSGRVYDLTNATKTVRFKDGLGAIVTHEDRTVVILAHPEAGRWSVSTAIGSPQVSRIRIAQLLPSPRIRGHVSGRGASRTLRYSVTSEKGQLVRFFEIAKGSLKLLRTVNGGGKGKVHYLTGEAKSARRTIIAEVSENGLPRKNLVIAHYLAPSPRVGRPNHIHIRRSGHRAIVTWRAATLARAYDVSVTDTLGRRTAYFVANGNTRLIVGAVAKSEGLRVIVVAVSRANRRGPAGTGALKGRQRHHKTHR